MENAEIVKNMEVSSPIWRKIIENIPAKKRFEIALLNKFFYSLVCDVDANRYALRVNSTNLADDAIFACKRKFKTIKFTIEPVVDENNIMYMTEILRVHGSNVENLSIADDREDCEEYLRSTKINARRWITLFQQVPRLKRLDLKIFQMAFKNWYNHPPILEQLETLLLSGVSQDKTSKFAAMFCENTIKSLNIHVFDDEEWKQLENFIKRQSKITELELCWNDALNVDAFKNLHLESLEICLISDEDSDSIRKLITEHPELKKLSINMLQGPYTVIFNSLNLEEIHLSIYGSTIHELNGLTNLQNLKKIVIGGESVMEKISTIQLPTLQHFDFIHMDHPASINFKIAGKIWPILKTLKTNVSTEGDNTFVINQCFENFNFLESLTIRCNFQDTFLFVNNGRQFSNIKELQFNFLTKFEFFSDMLRALPNLEILKFDYCNDGISFSPTLLSDLLNMKLLSELKIDFEFKSKYNGATPYSLSLLKSLCHRIKKFTIKFNGSSEFIKSFIEGTQEWDFVEKKIAYDSSALTLTNFIY